MIEQSLHRRSSSAPVINWNDIFGAASGFTNAVVIPVACSLQVTKTGRGNLYYSKNGGAYVPIGTFAVAAGDSIQFEATMPTDKGPSDGIVNIYVSSIFIDSFEYTLTGTA